MQIRRVVIGVACFIVALGALEGSAQPGKPIATVTPLAQRDAVQAGRTARVALRVTLPQGLHVQSNTPRDPSLIPTALTVDAPAGVTVTTTVYPRATDLTQAGQSAPLSVYGHEFAVGVELKVDGTVPHGELSIPARLRYQACDERVCFPPTTARFTWGVRVVPAGMPLPPAQHDEIFGAISFSRERQ